MIECHAAGCTYFQFSRLAATPGLTHAVFTRQGGNSRTPYAGLNLSAVTGDDRATVMRNRALVEEVLGLPLVAARAAHGNTVIVVATEPGETLKDFQTRIRAQPADAMLTDQPGFAMCWAFGDCAPILLYDPRHRVVALVHAGWRGTAAAVVVRAVEALRREYRSQPGEVLAGIGPTIGACCYEISDDVLAAFSAHPFAREHARIDERPRKNGAGMSLWLDVAASSHAQLRACGLREEHIELSGYCTGCRTDLFYSHRVEPKPSGRFAVAIGLSDGVQ